jgi:hypothetical protein
MDRSGSSDSKRACVEECSTRLQECESGGPTAGNCQKRHRKCLTECELAARGMK